MHYPAMRVECAQRICIINWCMDKHVQCVMCCVWCVVMPCEATLSLSLTLSGYGHWYTSDFFSVISLLRHCLFVSIWASVCTLKCLPLLTPSVSSVSCIFVSCLAGFPLSGSVFVVSRFLSIYTSVGRSLLPSVCRLSPPLTVFLLCACPFLHSYVFLWLPHISSIIIRNACNLQASALDRTSRTRTCVHAITEVQIRSNE